MISLSIDLMIFIQNAARSETFFSERDYEAIWEESKTVDYELSVESMNALAVSPLIEYRSMSQLPNSRRTIRNSEQNPLRTPLE
jgi:hypothetical protein